MKVLSFVDIFSVKSNENIIFRGYFFREINLAYLDVKVEAVLRGSEVAEDSSSKFSS